MHTTDDMSKKKLRERTGPDTMKLRDQEVVLCPFALAIDSFG